jgi:hypothetical protein
MKLKSMIAAALLIPTIGIQPALAQVSGSAQHLSQSLTHSGQAIGHASIGTVKLTAAVVAVPLKIVGTVGRASGHAGDAIWDFANEPAKPLALGDDTLTAAPTPAQAMLD